jgi:perosamine synthetase
MIQIGDFHFTRDQTESVCRMMATDRISPTQYVPEFERQFAQRHGCLYGLMTNSGTDALRVIVAAMKEKYGWNDGDSIYVPALTFVATVNVVIQNGLVPVPIDVSMYDFNLNPWRVEQKFRRSTEMGDKPRAVLVAHLAGRMAEMNALMEICKERDLKVIEDSCETVGVGIQGRMTGSWGEAGAFSFYMAHHITTGVGGMITTNDKTMNDLCRSLINHGRDIRYIPGYTKEPLSKELLKVRYKFDRIGYSCRPTEFEAALGLEQLKMLDENLKRRQYNAEWLLKVLGQYRGLSFPCGIDLKCHSWMFFPILVKVGVDKYDLCLHLEKHGIETRDLLPLIDQPCYKAYNWELKSYPTAKEFYERGFFIGCHPYLEQKDLENIDQAFNSYFAKNLTKEVVGAIN